MTNVAQQYIIADMISRGMFNTNLLTFFGLRNDFQGGYSAGNNSNEITLMELFNIMMGGQGGIYSGSFPDGLRGVLKSNFKANGLMMILGTALVPVAFRMGTKALNKPIIRPANKLLKQVGIGKEVVL